MATFDFARPIRGARLHRPGGGGDRGLEGIGRGIAEALPGCRRRGDGVRAHRSRTAPGSRRPPTRRDRSGRPSSSAADVREAEQASALIAAAVERFGRLDALVNNAGGSPQADAADGLPPVLRSRS